MKKYIRKYYGIVPLLSVLLLIGAQPAHAVMTLDERRDLAQSFLARLKNVYSDEAAPEKTSKERSNQPKTIIPDGSELLLRPKLGKRSYYENDVFTVKKDGRLYLSFLDLITVLDLPIEYDIDSFEASGWFLREDWQFFMDYDSRTVRSKGREIAIAEEDTYIDRGDLMVSSTALAQWFDIELEPNLLEQSVIITSEYPFPPRQEKERQERAAAYTNYDNRPKFPLHEDEYALYDIHGATIRAGTSYRRNEFGRSRKNYTVTSTQQGEIARHGFFTVTSFTKEDGLNNATARLFKESREPELLGPLKARSYSVGDVEQVSIPLTPGGSQELGFNISNNPLERIDFRTTDITGNAVPLWDVELYRNGVFQGLIEVDESGRFEFNDIQLFAGDNEFEVVFYGPQGEIRKEEMNIPVDLSVLQQQEDVYEVAVTQIDEQTFRETNINDVDVGKINAAGRYNFFLGDTLSYLGFRHASVEGEKKSFATAGFTKTWNEAIVDGSFAVDEEGELGTSFLYRKDYGDTQLSLQADLATDNYAPSGSTDPAVLFVDAGLSHNFGKGRNSSSVGLDAEYQRTASGETLTEYNAGLANNFGRTRLSNVLRYRESTGADRTDFNYIASIRSRMKDLIWRLTANYEIEEESRFDSILLNANYNHSKTLKSDLRIDHSPETNFTEGRLGLSWQHEKFLLTPFIDYDTDDELFAGINVFFSAVDKPDSLLPEFTRRNIRNMGSVSAFVFWDKDGNLVFDGEDEPLENVYIESVNLRGRAATNEKGIAIIPAMQSNRRTDIRLDEKTFPDPFMVSRYEEKSVFVRPGGNIHFEMPVQLGGDMDGTLHLKSREGANREFGRVAIYLEPLETGMNKRLRSSAVNGGFFVFSLIPPGRYYLNVDGEDAETLKAGRPVPKLIEIGYDGTVLYGQDVVMQQGVTNVGFNVLNEEEAALVPLPPVADRKQAAPEVFIRLDGEKESSFLLRALYDLRQKKLIRRYLSDLPVARGKTGDGKAVTRYHVTSGNLQEAFDRCRAVSSHRVPCTVETGLPPSYDFLDEIAATTDAENGQGA